MKPEDVRCQLAGYLPPATLVTGPGAWDLVTSVAGIDWSMHWDLDAAGARGIRQAAYMMPPGRRRVFAVNLDGTSWLVQNILLKAVEEPPPTTRFVLAKADLPVKTLVGRCRVLVLSGSADQPAADPRDMASVGTAIKAARARNAPLLAQVVRNWTAAHVRLLETWAAEAASGRWQTFGPDFAPGVEPAQAWQLVAEMGLWHGTRLGPMVALDKVFSQG